MRTSRSSKKMPLAVRLVIVVAGLVILAVGGYFLLVQPKKSEAKTLDSEIVDQKRQISDRHTQAQQAAGLSKILVADAFKLATAMPDEDQTAEAHLEINSIARATGVSYEGIQPGEVIDAAEYQVLPFQLTFQGTFYDLSDFLRRLQSTVLVENNELIAKGRLFTVDQVTFDEGDEGFPSIQASVHIYAYVYGHPIEVEGSTPPETASATPAEGSEESTSATEEGDTDGR